MPAIDRSMTSQVKLLGDFDGWSRGIDLSAEDTAAGDSVFTQFTSTLLLPKVRDTAADDRRWHHPLFSNCWLLVKVFA